MSNMTTAPAVSFPTLSGAFMLRTSTLEDLSPGDVAYAVPDALEVDVYRKCWIRSSAAALAYRPGRMRVEVDGYGRYEVTLVKGHQYKVNFPRWDSAQYDEMDYVPVAKINDETLPDADVDTETPTLPDEIRAMVEEARASNEMLALDLRAALVRVDEVLHLVAHANRVTTCVLDCHLNDDIQYALDTAALRQQAKREYTD